MNNVSLIINTAIAAPHAAQSGNPFRSASYADREALIERILDQGLPEALEKIVSGSYKPSLVDPPAYTYLDVPPIYGDRRDALVQREMGARLSVGDFLVFTHDDHLPNFHASDIPEPDDWDILVPKRVHGVTGEELSNGRDEDYMGGHTLIMTREAWVRVPWLAVLPERCWDLFLTELWRTAGLQIKWTDDLISVDLEAKAGEL